MSGLCFLCPKRSPHIVLPKSAKPIRIWQLYHLLASHWRSTFNMRQYAMMYFMCDHALRSEISNGIWNAVNHDQAKYPLKIIKYFTFCDFFFLRSERSIWNAVNHDQAKYPLKIIKYFTDFLWLKFDHQVESTFISQQHCGTYSVSDHHLQKRKAFPKI